MGFAESVNSVRRTTIDHLRRARGLILDNPLAVIVGVGGTVLLVDGLLRLALGILPVYQLLSFLLEGLILGLIVGLAGIGLSMTYSILGFANFSHGDYVTTGGFTGWAITWILAGIGQGAKPADLVLLGLTPGVSVSDLNISIVATPLAILVGLAVAAVCTVAVVLALDRVVFKPMRDAGGISLLIASIGVALALRYLIVFVWQAGTQPVTAVGDVGGFRFVFRRGAINLGFHEITLIVTAVVLMFGVHVLLQRTKLGKAMRAMADNKDLARVTGIPTERIVTYTWVIGGGLAGVAGYLIALERGTLSFQLGWLLLLLIFAAVILGGIGSIYGAMIGGLVIGFTQTLSVIWIPTSLSTAASFAVMVLILLFRPEGLFGGVTTA